LSSSSLECRHVPDIMMRSSQKKKGFESKVHIISSCGLDGLGMESGARDIFFSRTVQTVSGAPGCRLQLLPRLLPEGRDEGA